MAERRYGFRFSFAEGCVLVGGVLLASFLIFVFGVYAGKELEARQAAENTRTVRLAVQTQQDESNGSRLSGEETLLPGKPPTDKSAVLSAPALSPKVSPPIQKTVEPPQKAIESPIEKPLPPPPGASALSPTMTKPSLPAQTPSSSQAPPRSSAGEVLSLANKKPSVGSTHWSVQVHATKDEEAAQTIAKQLREQGYAPVVNKTVRGGEVWYRIRVGSFTSEEAAQASIARFRRDGKFARAYLVSD
jgi:cell division protein FtsN